MSDQPEDSNAALRIDADRKKCIEERRRNSTLWKCIHLLGSLQLALFLIAAIAIACAIATFYESGFNAKIAQHYIYKAPWFIFWQALLCINLFAVTLTRWPWQKKHIGFVITHYGIITLLAGAFIGSQWGFEGNVTLHTDRPPLSSVTTSRSIIQIEDPGTGIRYIKTFDASVDKPSPEKPKRLRVPDSSWTVVATETAEHLVKEPVLLPEENGKPGAILKMSSKIAGRDKVVALSLAEESRSKDSLFGMANVELVATLPEEAPLTLLENRMVFTKFTPVSQGDPANFRIRLSENGETVTLEIPEGSSATYRIREVLGKDVKFAGAQLTFQEFWGDFEMHDGRPSSRSGEPNNPAILVRILHSEATASTADSANSPGLRFALSEDGNSIEYQLLRGNAVITEASAKESESFATGWNDWTAEVLQIAKQASIGEQIRPANENVEEEKTGIPGFLAYLDPGEGPPGDPIWVESGKVSTIASEHRILRLGYGLQLTPLPFSIRLLKFEVPRLEGTQTPANFIATVEFFDPSQGTKKQDEARMNRPANWPGGWWGLLSGQNYKFSQAEWNPKDLGETTLQVLYDPGWLLKWIGSLGICTGITLMFYWKPSRPTQKPALS